MNKPEPDREDEQEHAADAAESEASEDTAAEQADGPGEAETETPETDKPSDPEIPPAKRPSFVSAFVQNLTTANTVMVTIFSFVLAMVIGALLIIASDGEVRRTFGYFFARPTDALEASWGAVSEVYAGLFAGSIVNFESVRSLLSGEGTWAQVLRPISETMTYSAPLILAGLAVGLAFRAGLFNIGAQGQVIMGAVGGAVVGFAFHLPVAVHLPLALLGGLIAGALFGAVPGVLKATTGTHEVITSIMLNYVALFGLLWIINVSWIKDPDPAKNYDVSKPVDESAMLPRLFGDISPLLRANAGIIVAIVVAVFVAWVLSKTTFGYRMRAVGLNPDASRAAGMSVPRTYASSMAGAGSLAGLAGAVIVLSIPPNALTGGVAGEVGFDGITVALLGRAKPVGIIGAGLLFGALRAGAQSMQSVIPLDMVTILQALIVIFIAAPALVKAILRLKTPAGGLTVSVAKGW